MSALKSDGKPMRALRALERSDAYNPMTEHDVCRVFNEGKECPSHGKREAA